MNSNKNSSRGRQQGKKKPQNSSKPGFNSKKKFAKNYRPKPILKRNIPTSGEGSSGAKQTTKSSENDGIRLNKYISNSGICSRREADVFIKAGSASVSNRGPKL